MSDPTQQLATYQTVWQRRIGAVLAGGLGYLAGALCNSSGLAVALFFILGYLGYNWLKVFQVGKTAWEEAGDAVSAILRALPQMPARLRREARAAVWFCAYFGVNLTFMLLVALILWLCANFTARIPEDVSFLESLRLQFIGNLVWMEESSGHFTIAMIVAGCTLVAGAMCALLLEPVIIFCLLVVRRVQARNLSDWPGIVRSVLWPMFYVTVLLVPHFVVTTLLVILHGLYSFRRLMHGVAVTVGGSVYLAFVPLQASGIPLGFAAIGCGLTCLGASELLFQLITSPEVDALARAARGLYHVDRRKALAASPA